MAVLSDIATVEIVSTGAAFTSGPGSEIAILEVLVPGLQGPAGVKNVYPQPLAPENPEVNWIWIPTPT